MAPTEVNPAGRFAHAYETLRTMVIRGQLSPGTRVVEKEIAERMGVSRTPAREAVLRLYREGFLTAKPTTRRTELVVAPLTRADMTDLYNVMWDPLESTCRHASLSIL